VTANKDLAIRVRDLGLRFFIRSHGRAPTVQAGLTNKIKKRPPPKEFWALRHLSFDVPRGTVMGVIGANGSGKSTLLRVLARIYAPDEGQMMIRGKVSSLITLGAGFQGNLSGIENIQYNALLLGLTPQEVDRKLDSIVEFAELGDFINAPTRTYSSGMRARLGFSVAVHVDPEILVVDEVLVVGDAKFRQKCGDKMRELIRSGVTVVLVQHNMDAILELAASCMWLEKGKLKMLGDPYQVVEAYLTSMGQPMPVRADMTRSVDAPELGATGTFDAGASGDPMM
jgi:ABC-type polysaccharide/polyol phosphate transport system ATPase subunit